MAEISFGGIAEEELSQGEIKFTVFSAPYEVTASYIKGMAKGAEAILDASTHMELYDEELEIETFEHYGIDTLDGPNLENLSPEEMVEAVQKVSEEIIGKGTVPVLLGGDHSVTTGLFRALKKKYSDLSVLHFDAHADLRDSYEGTPYNHACTGRRIAEDGTKLVQVGIRSLSVEEGEYLKSDDSRNVKTYFAKDLKSRGVYFINIEEIREFLTDNIFITIDLDVFDPSIMPATGTPEPGGLGWYEVLGTIKEVISGKNVVGFDCVELCPIEGLVAPDFMAAKLVYRIMGYIGVEGKE